MLAHLWPLMLNKLRKSSGLDESSLLILYYLSDHPSGLTQRELAGHLMVSEPALTRIMGRMLAKGLVERGRMLGDGRAWLVKMTEDGMEALRAYSDLVQQFKARLLSDLPEGDLGTMLRVTHVLNERLTDGESDPMLGPR